MDPSGQHSSGAAQRRRQRRLRSWWRHEQQWIEAALATFQHHSAPRGQKKAGTGEEDHEVHFTAKVRTHPPPQAASTVYYTCVDDEEVLTAGMRPAPLSEVAGSQERVQRHTVEQTEDFVHVPREGASIPAVLEHVIVPLLTLRSWSVWLVSGLCGWPCRRWLNRRLDRATSWTSLWSSRKRRRRPRRRKRWKRRKSWSCSTSPSTGSSTPVSSHYMAGRCDRG